MFDPDLILSHYTKSRYYVNSINHSVIFSYNLGDGFTTVNYSNDKFFYILSYNHKSIFFNDDNGRINISFEYENLIQCKDDTEFILSYGRELYNLFKILDDGINNGVSYD